MSTSSTSSPLGFGDEKEVTYFVATNVGQLPYLIDQGVRHMASSAN